EEIDQVERVGHPRQLVLIRPGNHDEWRVPDRPQDGEGQRRLQHSGVSSEAIDAIAVPTDLFHYWRQYHGEDDHGQQVGAPGKLELIRRLTEGQRKPDRQADYDERHRDGDDRVDWPNSSEVDYSVPKVALQGPPARCQDAEQGGSSRPEQSHQIEE